MHLLPLPCPRMGARLLSTEHQGDALLGGDLAAQGTAAPGQHPLQHAHREPDPGGGGTSVCRAIVPTATPSGTAVVQELPGAG